MHFRLAFLSLFFLSAITGAALAQSDPPSAIHGFNDVSLKSAYVTPRGLMVANNGPNIQILNGLVFGLYNNPNTMIDNVALVGGIWNDINTGQNSTTVGPWNEFDWFAGANIGINKNWTFGASYVAFLSPPGNFDAEHNLEFTLKFDDSGFLKPISLHPYGKLFYEFSGPSVVVTGKGAGTFDIELGIVPTLDLHPYNVPATLTMPTWITVGPSDFWGGDQNVGVFSTGIAASFPITSIPKQFGNWDFHLGVQYYNMLNDKLLLAQTFVGSVGPKSAGERNVVTGFAGFGLNF